MILYYGVTPYHFLCFLIDKLSRHPDEDAFLLIPERINYSDLYFTKINESGIFQKVYQYSEFFPKGDYLSAEILDEIISKTNNIVKNYKIDLRDFSEINVACDHYSFGLFLNLNNIKYNFWEDGRGRLGTDNFLLEHLEKINKIRFELIKKYSLLGHSKNVIYRFGDLSVQNNKKLDPRDRDFCLIKELKKLCKNDLNKILGIFGIDENLGSILYQKNEKSSIIITQHYLNLGLLKRDQQIKLYQFLADVFAIGQIYLKIHPSDIVIPYKKYFNNIKIIQSICPSELIALICPPHRFARSISVSSTSVDIFKECSDEIIIFTQELEKNVDVLPKYFSIALIIKELNFKNIFTIGIDDILLSNIVQKGLNGGKCEFVSQKNINKDTLIIMGNVIGDGFRETQKIIRDFPKNTIIFGDLDLKGLFINNHNLKVKDKIQPIQINIRKNDLSNEEDFIYILNNKDKVNVYFKKVFLNSNYTLEINMRNEDNILALRGINRALEERLRAVTTSYKNLLQENKALQQKIYSANIKSVDDNQISKNNTIYYKIEDALIRLISNDKKYKKYKRDRFLYFKDSKIFRFIRKFKH